MQAGKRSRAKPLNGFLSGRLPQASKLRATESKICFSKVTAEWRKTLGYLTIRSPNAVLSRYRPPDFRVASFLYTRVKCI